MKPFDDMELPIGAVLLDKVVLPPYPLLEFAMFHPARKGGFAYFMLTREGFRVFKYDGRNEEGICADLLDIILGCSKVQQNDFWFSDKSLLFDLYTRKAYLADTETAKVFVKSRWMKYALSFIQKDMVYLLDVQKSEKRIGIQWMDSQSSRERMESELTDWYKTEDLRKNKDTINNILVGDDPVEVVCQMVGHVKSTIQNIQIILKDAHLADQNHHKLDSFFSDLEEIKVDLALLQAYANYELETYN